MSLTCCPFDMLHLWLVYIFIRCQFGWLPYWLVTTWICRHFDMLHLWIVNILTGCHWLLTILTGYPGYYLDLWTFWHVTSVANLHFDWLPLWLVTMLTGYHVDWLLLGFVDVLTCCHFDLLQAWTVRINVYHFDWLFQVFRLTNMYTNIMHYFPISDKLAILIIVKSIMRLKLTIRIKKNVISSYSLMGSWSVHKSYFRRDNVSILCWNCYTYNMSYTTHNHY